MFSAQLILLLTLCAASALQASDQVEVYANIIVLNDANKSELTYTQDSTNCVKKDTTGKIIIEAGMQDLKLAIKEFRANSPNDKLSHDELSDENLLKKAKLSYEKVTLFDQKNLNDLFPISDDQIRLKGDEVYLCLFIKDRKIVDIHEELKDAKFLNSSSDESLDDQNDEINPNTPHDTSLKVSVIMMSLEDNNTVDDLWVRKVYNLAPGASGNEIFRCITDGLRNVQDINGDEDDDDLKAKALLSNTQYTDLEDLENGSLSPLNLNDGSLTSTETTYLYFFLKNGCVIDPREVGIKIKNGWSKKPFIGFVLFALVGLGVLGKNTIKALYRKLFASTASQKPGIASEPISVNVR